MTIRVACHADNLAPTGRPQPCEWLPGDSVVGSGSFDVCRRLRFMFWGCVWLGGAACETTSQNVIAFCELLLCMLPCGLAVIKLFGSQ